MNFSIVSCWLLLSSSVVLTATCAHKPGSQTDGGGSTPVVEWRLVSKNPLTYAPKSYTGPLGNEVMFRISNYDKTVCYVLPNSEFPQHMDHALAIREESLPPSMCNSRMKRVGDSLENALEALLKAILEFAGNTGTG